MKRPAYEDMLGSDAVKRYVELLYAAPHGLIGRNDRGLVSDHVADALAVLPWVSDIAPGSLVDVGSGAGLPGIPLALCLPSMQVALVESQRRKAEFLAGCVAALDLTARCTVRNERVERTACVSRETYDLAVCRALAAPVTALEWLAPLTRVGGHVAIMTTGRLASEQSLGDVAGQLGLDAPAVIRVNSPLRDDAVLVTCLKRQPTAARFPRREGVARRRPLVGGA